MTNDQKYFVLAWLVVKKQSYSLIWDAMIRKLPIHER